VTWILRLAALFTIAGGGLIGVADFLPTDLSGGSRLLLTAAGAAGLGAGVALSASWLVLRLRLGPLVAAAGALARGELDASIPLPGSGLEGRLGRELVGIAHRLAETHSAATTDRLTGVANRQSVLAVLFGEVERAGRYHRPLSVAFVDIDHFKQVNDTYGHGVGDSVLRGVAQTIKTHLRASDTIGRYGGEEFLIVLPETSVDDAAALAEKLRLLVARQQYPVEGSSPLAVTISIGIAGGIGEQLRVEELVHDADAAMYSAKSLGRNQTYVFAEPSDDARVPRAPISPQVRAAAMAVGRRAREAAQGALLAAVADLPEHRGRPSPLAATIAVEMASQLDLAEGEMERLRVGALLHDIGKIVLPAEVLDKPGPLTAAEWRLITQHARVGQLILEQATLLRDAVPIVLHHHERYSGHGYPFGLRGHDIPLGARILAVADAYDAMIHPRPYRPALDHAEAVQEIQRGAGTQFDPEIVRLFVELYADAPPMADPLLLQLAHGHRGGEGGHRRRRLPGASASA
jgi:diguanylate cyclase (GGDEF)-like protein/putative nucleotidyltransferase with HDIG domain